MPNVLDALDRDDMAPAPTCVCGCGRTLSGPMSTRTLKTHYEPACRVRAYRASQKFLADATELVADLRGGRLHDERLYNLMGSEIDATVAGRPMWQPRLEYARKAFPLAVEQYGPAVIAAAVAEHDGCRRCLADTLATELGAGPPDPAGAEALLGEHTTGCVVGQVAASAAKQVVQTLTASATTHTDALYRAPAVKPAICLQHAPSECRTCDTAARSYVALRASGEPDQFMSKCVDDGCNAHTLRPHPVNRTAATRQRMGSRVQ